MKKLLTLCAAVLASVGMWAADPVVLFSTDFSDASWTGHETICAGSTAEETVNGIFFRSANNSKQYTIADGALTFCDNNSGNAYFMAIPVQNVNGKVTVTIGTVSNGQRVNYLFRETNEISTSSVSMQSTAANINTAQEIVIEYTMKGAGTEALVMLGRQGSGQKTVIKTITITTPGPDCQDAEASFSASEVETYIEDEEEITLSFSSNITAAPTYAVTLDGEAAVEDTEYTLADGKFVAKAAGTFVITATQATNGTYCDVEKSVTIEAKEKAKVTACTINGPATAYVGEAVTFTATAANASDYAWEVDGVDANTNAAEFTFTPAAADEYSIVCKARNQFNAANEWIVSDAKVLTASNVSGEIIKVELTSGTAATVTGILGGTADVNLSSSKKMDKGKYFGFTLAKGAFAEGDTVIITMSAKGSNYPCLFADKNKETLLYLATETSDALEYKIVLPAAANGLTSLYFARDENDEVYKWNPTFTSVSVIRPKAVKSTSEVFKSVSFNDEPLDANFDENHAMTVEGSYVDAPVVVFTKTVTTIYEDNSQATKDVEVNVTAEDVEGAWQAQATINSVTYTINATKAASHTVTYMNGETKLGEELVAHGAQVEENAKYETLQLATFGKWYTDAELTNEADLTAAVNEDKTLYASFTYNHAQSVNIEQLVLDNGTAYDLMSFMGGKGFASNITNSLDTLNDLEKKDNRNYAFLGLKVKAEGKLLDFRLAANSTVKVKFGNVGATPLVSINGGEYATMELAEGVYSYTATAEALISIKTASSATLIFKQIMIDAELAEVVLPAPSAYAITLTSGKNGQLAASWEGKTDKKVNVPVGATVTLTVTPATGYQVTAVTVNSEAIEAVEGVYSFVMPAANVTVSATFDVPSALDNTDAAVKAVKRIVNGQLLIEKNGVLYNAQGAVVK